MKPTEHPQEQRWLGATAPSRIALIPPLSAARWLLVLVIAAGIYFFHGFLVPVLAALVIGFASWPIYRDILRRCGGNRALAASVAIILILTFLIVPIVLAVSYTIGEIGQWFTWAVETNRTGSPTPEWMAALPGIGEWVDEQWYRYIGHPGAIGELVQIVSGANIGSIYRGVLAAGTGLFDLFLTLLFMMIALFFVYKDGENFVAQLDTLGERILPMRWSRISRVVPATISSTVMGMTLIAIGEGIVLGIAYWIAGVPSPVTLGVITGVMALIPGGAPLSFTLVSIYLVASGSPVEGIALFVWGSTELFIVDKTLRPKLVGGPIKLPFLPTFFGLIGGVKTMGFLGLFIGPVLMALLVAIWREWLHEMKTPEPAILPPPGEAEPMPPPRG
ncbi:AI-2E family transporter [Mesorhizobium microcysteis]|jgi:predicted PurR-regulated permease PerM|uniref:AI-2E family transporter n=1 Tax=Neoaquamicrobium microcysteis TaxID=2682781 RepID=A0A5D4GRK6_9HYPH|nr:AI-2E family transporter [Mesorhizobium microcysteis]TYR30662.1 AI-2E family transporter [Mesorhizobium microcysteis]